MGSKRIALVARDQTVCKPRWFQDIAGTVHIAGDDSFESLTKGKLHASVLLFTFQHSGPCTALHVKYANLNPLSVT